MRPEEYLAKRRSEIAQNLRLLRRYHGWSQKRVADYLDCSRCRVNRVEQGYIELGVAELELLAQAFDVPLTQILDAKASLIYFP